MGRSCSVHTPSSNSTKSRCAGPPGPRQWGNVRSSDLSSSPAADATGGRAGRIGAIFTAWEGREVDPAGDRELEKSAYGLSSARSMGFAIRAYQELGLSVSGFNQRSGPSRRGVTPSVSAESRYRAATSSSPHAAQARASQKERLQECTVSPLPSLSPSERRQ